MEILCGERYIFLEVEVEMSAVIPIYGEEEEVGNIRKMWAFIREYMTSKIWVYKYSGTRHVQWNKNQKRFVCKEVE